ncbi:MAG: diaminopimelate epimerase [Lachnospiraceae bacterium]|nr:diaminopimelate epimerase [Lachnospiraceae bacterium]MBQ8328932.1 diaminopimelate epimerase [Lachnospiraceae bacterium]
MRFTKMEGCGNDYVYINGISQTIPEDIKPELVRKMSDRHFGIGGDGVIFINSSQIADFEMEMYNADGSRGEMCGNGIRCVGKFVYDYGLTDQTQITVESFKKIKYLTLYPEGGFIKRVRVNMGPAILESSEIPVLYSEEEGRTLILDDGSKISCAVVDAPLEIGDEIKRVTCVSMGNPHAVLFVDNTEDLPLNEIGPLYENHRRFPNRINTEFVQVIDEGHVRMRVWERGSGETLACGTGCCATGVACVLNGKTGDRIIVDVLGGSLEIEWDKKSNNVWMTGPARTVFEGSVDTTALLKD